MTTEYLKTDPGTSLELKPGQHARAMSLKWSVYVSVGVVAAMIVTIWTTH